MSRLSRGRIRSSVSRDSSSRERAHTGRSVRSLEKPARAAHRLQKKTHLRYACARITSLTQSHLTHTRATKSAVDWSSSLAFCSGDNSPRSVVLSARRPVIRSAHVSHTCGEHGRWCSLFSFLFHIFHLSAFNAKLDFTTARVFRLANRSGLARWILAVLRRS